MPWSCFVGVFKLPVLALLLVPSWVTRIFAKGREGTQEPLMLSIGALPSERAAPNSQRRGPKHPGLVTLVAVSKGGCLAAPLPQTARGGDRRAPRGLLAHPFLGASAPLRAPRARVPLFRFRPPLPCPRPSWDVVVHGVTLLLAPAGKCGCLACSAFRIIPLAPWECRFIFSVQLLTFLRAGS